MKTIYVITYELNEYDQYGEYLYAWFTGKPILQDLLELGFSHEDSNHILTGGGRRNKEHLWYNLTEVTEGKKFQEIE